jgi:uncharacterized membrane protein
MSLEGAPRAPEGGSVKTATALLAAAAGALFLASPALADHHEKGENGKMKCEGVNQCKGHGACHSASNECSGKNECKGKGFVMMTPEECKAAKDKMEKEG